MECLKCGFDDGSESDTCTKCGVIHAKVRQVSEQQIEHRRKAAAERAISDLSEKRLKADETISASLNPFHDTQYLLDKDSYPVTEFLSGFFLFMAACTAIVEFFGLVYFYQWGKLFFSSRELVLYMASIVVTSAGSVVVLLAISEGLKMGRNVANNTRATREYLRQIAGR
ncbi:MAG: hypothetical protein MH219_05480 [Marinobacter sp.]|jgi:hypothetical protein|nr:hypothetical protein [Marinobacter sp.]